MNHIDSLNRQGVQWKTKLIAAYTSALQEANEMVNVQAKKQTERNYMLTYLPALHERMVVWLTLLVSGTTIECVSHSVMQIL